MSDLVEFAKRFEEQLTSAIRQPHWEADKADRYMMAIAGRCEKCETQAARLIDVVILPRLETLASYFSNDRLSRDEPVGRCSCWFGYGERFPSRTNVAFAVEHDVRLEKMAVCFDTSMMPAFIKMNEQDRLTEPLHSILDDVGHTRSR